MTGRTWFAAGVALCVVLSGCGQATSPSPPSQGTVAPSLDVNATPAAPASSVIATGPSAASANPDASPGTIEVTFDYGPGTFDFTNPVAGLDGLASYKSALTLSFSGTAAGQPSQWTQSYETIVASNPAGRQINFTEPSDDGSGAPIPVYRADLGGVSYEVRGDDACQASTTIEADALAQRWEPAKFIPGVTAAVESGPETINGIPTTRYDFDERAFGVLPESKSVGHMWVATDGGYLTKYSVTTDGADDYFGDGVQGTLTTEYAVTDVNGIDAIALPAGCADELLSAADLPLLPDATDVLRSPDSISYASASSPADAASFYHDQLASMGWTSVVAPTDGDALSVETFNRDAEQLIVIVGTSEAGTTVRLLLGPLVTD